MYTNIRKKLNKFVDGGKIPKFEQPWGGGIQPAGDPKTKEYWEALGYEGSKAQLQASKYIAGAIDENGNFHTYDQSAPVANLSLIKNNSTAVKPGLEAIKADPTPVLPAVSNLTTVSPDGKVGVSQNALNSTLGGIKDDLDKDALKKGVGVAFGNIATQLATQAASAIGGQSAGQGVSMAAGSIKDMVSNGFSKGSMGNLAAGAGVAAVNMVDKMAMGDKNFGAQSEAIDGAVHTASGALMKSGNPYAIAAGAALEGINFLTKAGGQTVQGFDVDINNSGYGNLGHMESSSSRSLFGIGNGHLKEKLARRNEQARMALTAAEISADSSFEQEARMNSVENTIMNNQIALSGGLETNMLAG